MVDEFSATRWPMNWKRWYGSVYCLIWVIPMSTWLILRWSMYLAPPGGQWIENDGMSQCIGLFEWFQCRHDSRGHVGSREFISGHSKVIWGHLEAFGVVKRGDFYIVNRLTFEFWSIFKQPLMTPNDLQWPSRWFSEKNPFDWAHYRL